MSGQIEVGQVREYWRGRHCGLRLEVERFVTTDELGRDWWVARSLSSPHRREYRDDELEALDLVRGSRPVSRGTRPGA